MQFAVDFSLQSIQDFMLEVLPQLGVAFLILLGVLLVGAVFGSFRRVPSKGPKAPTHSPPGSPIGSAKGEAYNRGAEGRDQMM